MVLKSRKIKQMKFLKSLFFALFLAVWGLVGVGFGLESLHDALFHRPPGYHYYTIAWDVFFGVTQLLVARWFLIKAHKVAAASGRKRLKAGES